MLADFLARDYFGHMQGIKSYSMWVGKGVTMAINIIVLVFAIYQGQQFRKFETASI